jgi:hypothetical protein
MDCYDWFRFIIRIISNNVSHHPLESLHCLTLYYVCMYRSYGVPTITGITGLMATSGSSVVTLTGTNFGPVGTTINTVLYGPSSASLVYTATGCSVSSTTPHTSISCTSVAGFGAIQVFRVTVNSLVSAVSTAPASYAPATITGVTATITPLPTTAATTFTIDGVNFGGANTPTTPTVQLTFYPTVLGVSYAVTTTCLIITDHQRVTCPSVAGVGSALTLTLSVGNKVGTAYASSIAYAAPTLTTASPAILNNYPSSTITLQGTNLGPTGLGSSLIVVSFGPGFGLTATGKSSHACARSSHCL